LFDYDKFCLSMRTTILSIGNDQIISIYYFVHADKLDGLQVKTKVFDFELHQIADPKGQSEVLRWIEWNDLTEESVV